MKSSNMALSFLALVSLLCSIGCDSRAEVTGVVTMDGKPLEGATINFVGTEGPASVSRSDAEGKFQLRYKGEALIPAGSYKVGIAKYKEDESKEKEVAEGAGAAAGIPSPVMIRSDPRPPKNLLPEKYRDPEKSGLTIEVARGMAPVEFKLEK